MTPSAKITEEPGPEKPPCPTSWSQHVDHLAALKRKKVDLSSKTNVPWLWTATAIIGAVGLNQAVIAAIAEGGREAVIAAVILLVIFGSLAAAAFARAGKSSKTLLSVETDIALLERHLEVHTPEPEHRFVPTARAS